MYWFGGHIIQTRSNPPISRHLCYHFSMKRLLPILIVFGLLLGCAGTPLILPECKGSPANTNYPINNWMNCKGTLEFGGNKYVGEFEKGLFHGQGIFTFASGDGHVGEYKDGKKHGQGAYTFVGGNKYVGDWKRSKEHTTDLQTTYLFSYEVFS